MQAQSLSRSQTRDSSWSTMFNIHTGGVAEEHRGWRRQGGRGRRQAGICLGRTNRKLQAEVVVLRTVSTSV